jgi:TRAP-type mannitol/chloroaromatic compound transport system substrate-binding protein
MNSRQMTAWMKDGEGLPLLREFYRDYNIVNFPCGNTGTQMGGFFRKEIKSVDDMKGLKFRIGGFGGVMLQRIGVLAQNIPGGEIYTAMEKGTIDAAEFIGPYDDEKLGLHKIAKFYHYPSYWDGCGQISMYVNSKAWESLPKEYQAIFDMACAEAHVDMQAKYDARNPQALKRLVAAGVQLRPFPKAWPTLRSPPRKSSSPSCRRRTRSGRRFTPATTGSAATQSCGRASRTARSTATWPPRSTASHRPEEPRPC